MEDERMAAEQAMVDDWLGADPSTSQAGAPTAGPAPATVEPATGLETNMALKNGVGEPDDHRGDPDREGAAMMHATKTKKRDRLDMDPDEVLDISLGTPTGSDPRTATDEPTAAVAPVPPAPVLPVPPPPMPLVAPPPSVVPPAPTPPGLFAATPPGSAPATAAPPPGLLRHGRWPRASDGARRRCPATGAADRHAATGAAHRHAAAPPGTDAGLVRAPLFYAPPEAEPAGPLPDTPAQPSAASLFTEILSATPDSSPIEAEPEPHDPGSVTQDMTIVAKRRKRFRLR